MMFNPSASFSILLTTLLLVFVSAGRQDLSQFGYAGSRGPNRWGRLIPNATTCLTGKAQSPINILESQTLYDTKLGSLNAVYHTTNATLVNHVVNVGVFFEESGGEMVIDGKKYTLRQMHWHTPSEHQINGVRFAAELHLVHLAEDGTLAVDAILYHFGHKDPLVSRIEEKLKELGKAKEKMGQIPLGKIDCNEIKKKTRKYYRYIGSLTTPPCSQNVTWTIFGKVRSISKEQVDLLEAPLDPTDKHNARPCQPLNGRKVELYHDPTVQEQDE